MVMIMVGDSLERLKELPENSVDSIVTDPPYGLAFMGKKWDYDVPSRELWLQCIRVLKPGGHLIAFAGSRTYHRLAINIEDAGFEIRDQIMWIYGSGFPKSLNISKEIDKAAGAERVDLGPNPNDRKQNSAIDFNGKGNDSRITAPATDDAKKWEGWGTALKPAHEPCVLARKPITENNVANNVLKHGTGGINIDETRTNKQGRYPANVIHDGSDEVREKFPDTKHSSSVNMHHEEYIPNNKNEVYGKGMGGGAHPGFDDVDTSAARFFYCAKTSKAEREAGLEHFKSAQVTDRKDTTGVGSDNPRNRGNKLRKNTHPTVKPIALMRYMCKLVTPSGGKILDPFLGSGTTGIAALLEGFDFIGCEISQEYADIATARMAHWSEADLVETDIGTSLELPPEAEWL